jgi:hypothetical protein
VTIFSEGVWFKNSSAIKEPKILHDFGKSPATFIRNRQAHRAVMLIKMHKTFQVTMTIDILKAAQERQGRPEAV